MSMGIQLLSSAPMYGESGRRYRRQLDLDTGVVRISYAMNGVHYVREAGGKPGRNLSRVH